MCACVWCGARREDSLTTCKHCTKSSRLNAFSAFAAERSTVHRGDGGGGAGALCVGAVVGVDDTVVVSVAVVAGEGEVVEGEDKSAVAG